MSRPVYSNVAFTLLMYAVGLARGLDYPALLYEYITGPLQMTNTYPSPGLTYWNSTIPPVGNSWGAYFVSGIFILESLEPARLTGSHLQGRRNTWRRPSVVVSGPFELCTLHSHPSHL